MKKQREQEATAGLASVAGLVRYRQFLSSLGSSAGQYGTPFRGSHSGPETMFIFSLSPRRLKCPFHDPVFTLFTKGANIGRWAAIYKTIGLKMS